MPQTHADTLPSLYFTGPEVWEDMIAQALPKELAFGQWTSINDITPEKARHAVIIICRDDTTDMSAHNLDIDTGREFLAGLFINPAGQAPEFPALYRRAISIPCRIGAVIDAITECLSLARFAHLDAEIALAAGARLYWRDNLLRNPKGESLRLTDKERDLLLSLYGTPGNMLSRQNLLEQVWSYVEGVETHTLETHIYRLRRKLEKDAVNPEILVTVEGGYKLMLAHTL